jgi:hypothetical protein
MTAFPLSPPTLYLFLPYVSAISLQYNQIGDGGVEKLAAALKINTTLKILE